MVVPRERSPEATKKRFLVTYEYGQGAIWAWLYASSAGRIRREFPELTVHEDPSAWMLERAADISERMVFDKDDEAKGFLAALLEQRRSRR
jgi:hypothetical protein